MSVWPSADLVVSRRNLADDGKTNHWKYSLDKDLLNGRAFIGDGFWTDYYHQAVCGAHPFFGICLSHPRECTEERTAPKMERLVILIIVLSIVTWWSSIQQGEE